jgi:hypothetical protein
MHTVAPTQGADGATGCIKIYSDILPRTTSQNPGSGILALSQVAAILLVVKICLNAMWRDFIELCLGSKRNG